MALVVSPAGATGSVDLRRGIRVRGRLRDEFRCPISNQMFRDPVIAMDGHTYERGCIMKWMETNTSSPKTGEEMCGTLIPNYNLKRLLRDMVEEGGEALVYKDDSGAHEDVIIKEEDILVLKCVGPLDNDMFGKTVVVHKEGITCGRRKPGSATASSKDHVIFQESTVSRSHFSIEYVEEDQAFAIRDEQSSGGTYLKVPFKLGLQLEYGTMILVGKHQFEVKAGRTVVPDDIGSMPGAEREAGDTTAHHASLHTQPLFYLHCFAPEGSPILGKDYPVTKDGATIGRMQSNSIPLCQEIGHDVVGLDSEVSGEHCRIKYDEQSGQFKLYDGSTSKPSTNGTWKRLSRAYERSPPHIVAAKDEVLIGEHLKFVALIEKGLVEKAYDGTRMDT